MFKYFKNLVKDSLFYSLSRILPKAIGFLLIPIYTRYLTPKDYGILSIVSLITSILSIFLVMGQNASVTRFYFDKYEKKSEKDYKILLGNILSFFLIFNGLIIFALIQYGKPLFQFLLKSENLTFNPYIILGLYTVFFGLPFGMLANLLRAKRKPKTYSLLHIAKFILLTISIIYFVVFLRQGALGSIRGGLITAFVFFLITLIFLRKEIVLKINSKIFYESLKYGLPLVPHQLLAWITNFSDRYILERFTKLSTVGIYTLGYNFGLVLNLVSDSISYAWGPFYYEIMSLEEDARKIISKLTTIVTVGITIIGALVIIYSYEVIKIMATERFLSAYIVIPPITASYVFFGTNTFIKTGLFYKKKTKIIPFITLIVALVNIVANLIFIPIYGMIAAAYSTLISGILSYLLSYYYSVKIFPFPYENGKLLKSFLFFFLLYWISIYIDYLQLSTAIGLVAKTFLFILYISLLLLFKVINPQEVLNLWKRIKKKLGK